MSRITLALWGAYALFVPAALWWGWEARPLAFDGRLPAVKVALYAVWLLFLAYSLHVSRQEDILVGLRRIGQIPWGRQVGLDLYAGLSLFLLVVGLHSGSPWIALAWLVPTYLFGNLSPLLWFAIHWDALVARLAA